jgi:hypothetical protein
MPRTRRFARIAALAIAGGLALTGSAALTGCAKAQPGTAAYVGDTRYTERQVDELVADARANVEGQRLGDIRREILRWLVATDLARRVAAARSIAIAPADYAAAAQQIRVPEDSRLAVAFGDYASAVGSLVNGVPPVQPTDEDVRDIYDAAKAGGVLANEITFEDAVQRIRGISDLPIRVGVMKAIQEASDKAGVVISPRYRPLVVDVLNLPFVVATGTTAVTDLPRP